MNIKNSITYTIIKYAITIVKLINQNMLYIFDILLCEIL